MSATGQAFIAVLVASVAVLAASCGEMTLSEKVKAVQDKAVMICSYMPKADSVQHMLLASNPTTQGIEAIANAICTAVIAWQNSQKTGSAFATECPKVNGVCVEGKFVDKPKGE